MENNNELPFISAKTLTYGRTEMLEEAIESFLRQDYPKDRCEMVIVNDYHRQELVYDHPQIRILNMREPFKTIGEKENYATGQCKGDIICQWDDDDIGLPNHLRNVAKWLDDKSPIVHWEKGIYWNEPNIVDIVWLGNSGIAFWKEAWKQVGRHPLENAGYDTTFVAKLHSIGNPVFARPEDNEVSWMYRWSFIPGGAITKVGVYHQSGQGTDDEISPNILQRHSIFIEERRQAGLIITGVIELKPQWHYDYVQQLVDFNNSKQPKEEPKNETEV